MSYNSPTTNATLLKIDIYSQIYDETNQFFKFTSIEGDTDEPELSD